MKKLKYRAVIGLRVAVLIVPGLLWIATDAAATKLCDACEWLSNSLPDPQKWR